MSLHELVLYGKHKQFGKWFHQVCFEVGQSASVLSNAHERSVAERIVVSKLPLDLSASLTVYIQELFMFYIQTILEVKFEQAGDAEKVHEQKTGVILKVMQLVFGPRTLGLNRALVDAMAVKNRIPQGNLTYLLIEELNLYSNRDLSDEGIESFKEAIFDLFEQITQEAVVSFLKEKFGRDDQVSQDMIESTGHEW